MEHTLMVVPESRPEDISRILGSLDRYNPENISTFQEYLLFQANNRTNDIVANLALLKLYQFNLHASKDDIIIDILVKALIRFHTSDFISALHLLPSYVLATDEQVQQSQPVDNLTDAVQILFHLYTLLDACKFTEFWQLYESDDSCADIVADVVGFEDDIRLEIAKTIEISTRALSSTVLQEWTNLTGNKFTHWVNETLKWTIKDGSVIIPSNKDNEAKSVVTTETVKFEQLGRIVKRAYELQ